MKTNLRICFDGLECGRKIVCGECAIFKFVFSVFISFSELNKYSLWFLTMWCGSILSNFICCI